MDMSDIAARLEVKFGLGSRPELRKKLYERLEELVYSQETPRLAEHIFEVIASVAADAVGKTDPGRYFAGVVLRRLDEKNLLPRKELSL